MSSQSVWVRCKVDQEEGSTHVLIKGHEIFVHETVARQLEAEGKVERLIAPTKAVKPPSEPEREQRQLRK